MNAPAKKPPRRIGDILIEQGILSQDQLRIALTEQKKRGEQLGRIIVSLGFTTEAIDRAMKLGTNYPFGPFEWADRVGLYNVVQVLESIRMETGEEKYRVAPLLRDYFRKSKNFKRSFLDL